MKHKLKHAWKRAASICLAWLMLLASGLSGLSVPVNVYAEDNVLHALNLWAADGSAGSGNMTVWKNASTSVSAPQVLYAWIGGDSLSLFCIDYDKAAATGDSYATSSDYNSLNRDQKMAIAYVLGCAEWIQAPRNNGSYNDYGGDVTWTNWRKYNSTQLMIWYYIDKYYTAGSNEGIGWEGVVLTCNAGWGDLTECERIKNIVDNLFVVPSFATKDDSVVPPSYELTYNSASGQYETILYDSNGVLGNFNFSGSGLTFTRCDASGTADSSGSYLKISSASPLTYGTQTAATGTHEASSGTLTYVLNQTSEQDLVLCNATRSDPVSAYLSVYTTVLGSLVIEKGTSDAGMDSASYSLAGAEYTVYSDAACQQAEAVITTSLEADGVYRARATGLAPGVYYVKETASPAGYRIDSTVYPVDVTQTNAAGEITATLEVTDAPYTTGIHLIKTDRYGSPEGDATLAGAVYGLYAAEAIMIGNVSYAAGDLIKEFPATDSNGEAELSGLPLGTYDVKEISASYGYELDTTTYRVNALSADSVTGVGMETLTCKETPITTDYHIDKYYMTGSEFNAELHSLSGCEFSLYLISDFDPDVLAQAADGSYDWSDFDFSSYTPVDVQTTDENGKAAFYGIYYGDYVLVETEVPDTYKTMEPRTLHFPMTDSSGSIRQTVYEPYINDWYFSRLKVLKLDSLTGETIAGTASFRILDAESGEYLSLMEYGLNGVQYTSEFTTNEAGEFYFLDQIPCGTYLLEETSVTEYFIPENIEFMVTPDGLFYRPESGGDWTEAEETGEGPYTVHVIEAYNTPRSVSVEKVDAEGNRLTGAVLGIAYADGNQPAVNEDGSYKLLTVPAVAEDGSYAADENGDRVMEDAVWMSEDALHVENYIPLGTWYLVELTAPDGYATADPIRFEVRDEVETLTVHGEAVTVDYNHQSLTMVDDVTKLLISKQDATTGKELPGATLVLTDASGTVIDTWISTEEAHTITQLTVRQTYTLTETIAPDGYEIAEEIQFTVLDTAQVQKVVMQDTPDTPDTPATGDSLPFWILLVAMGLCGISVIRLICKYKEVDYDE